MSLLKLLLERPKRLSSASQFTSINGLIYLASGFLLLLWPQVVQLIFFESEFIGREQSMLRLMGMMLSIVGWLYLFGGRSGGRQFVAATIVDRLVLVPVVLIPCVILGIFPWLLGTFAILDPMLAIIAWLLLLKDGNAAEESAQAS